MNSKRIQEKLLQKLEHNAIKKVIHIIASGKKWAVVKFSAKRASKLFTYREQAYFYAKQMGKNIVVHNDDGSVLFSESL